MSSLGELTPLTDQESADLASRVERFTAAWKADGATPLEEYLPPPGSRHRLAVLTRIVVTDMERRAPAGLPFRGERYVNLFPDELSTTDMPVALLVAEYRLRHRHTDKPKLDEYRRWFPDQYDAMVEQLAQLSSVTMAGQNENTPLTSVSPVPDMHRTSDGAVRGTVIGTPRPSHPSGVRPRPNSPERHAAATDVLPSDAPYQLVRKLGSGAFGEVFEALAPGGVRVAVKRILRSVDHPASKSEEESLEAIKWLSHPFLLKTNAYWVFDDRLVIVMELADGSLTDRIEHYQAKGLPGVPPEELVPFFEQAAEALDYLHSQNISHRDVKPENLLVLQGYAKVADFGLARLHEHAMTVVPNTVGTPAYMAPEMWQQKVSLQSDQYSLAATYVRARLGRLLFSTNVLVDQANSHINEKPNLDPLPPAEQAVLLKGLAKKPEERYSSCLEFAKALQAAVFPPPPPPEPPKQRESGNRVLVLLVGAALLACATTVGVVLSQRGEQPKDKPAEKEPEKQTPVVIVQPQRIPPWCPDDWTPDPKAGIETISQYTLNEYHRRLTRKVGQDTLVAILVPKKRYTDPTPFYMLENKITNKQFTLLWEEGLQDKSSAIYQFQEQHPNLTPGDWRKQMARNGDPIDIAGKHANAPVLGVTAPEALLAAARLGGQLPTFKQWSKAVGATTGTPPDDTRDGPAGEGVKVPPAIQEKGVGAVNAYRRQALAGRNLALDLDTGPWPVTKPTEDRSFCGIHQLATNGAEWIDEDTFKQRCDLTSLSPGETHVRYVGLGPNEFLIPTFEELRTKRSDSWLKTTDPAAGFRIVLEVR